MKKWYKSVVSIHLYILGAYIRYYLISSKYRQLISERVEVSTPINSWKRVTEGLYLEKLGIDPFSGDFLHEQPLNLYLYGLLTRLLGEFFYIVFIACDILTALLLHLAAKKYMKRLEEEDQQILSEDEDFVTDLEYDVPPTYVSAAYLFNPFIIFNCVGFTTTCFNNLFLALFFVALMYGEIITSAFCVAVCATHGLYPILMISPLFLNWTQKQNVVKAVISLVLVVTLLLLLTTLSYYLQGSWKFLADTYGFILSVPDLTPNIGLFWYFFIEMFEHFRTLFICSLQINVALLYFIPLSIRLRHDPMLLATTLLCLIAIFKSYPCLGDIGFVLALLPCWKHLFNYVQQGFIVCGCFLVTAALAPTVWHLWIYSGSANANFYFGVTLAFATAQIFLITDILFAYIKREFIIKYGKSRVNDGQSVQLILE